MRHAIGLKTSQTYSYEGTFSPIPQLFTYDILPTEYYVFNVVKEGKLEELQALLRESKASLRDQDEFGASLLHVISYLLSTPLLTL